MQVHVIQNENGVEEWIALEMQGNMEGSSLDGLLIGNFAWNKDNTEVVLVIGHHLLDGKLVEMDKPYIVASPRGDPNDRTMIVDGIVTRKVVFKNRPKPIVSKPTVRGDMED